MKKDNNGISENPMYHDTWTLLKKYRDVVWSLELSVQKVRRQFQIEYGSSTEAISSMRKLLRTATSKMINIISLKSGKME